MNVLLFVPMTGEVVRQLETVINCVSQVSELSVCHTAREFRRLIACRAESDTVAVLYTPTRDSLSEVLSLDDMLLDRRVILVLPDDEPETVAQGHRLRPRFLTYVDCDLSEIADVLSRMLGSVKKGTREPTDALQERIA